VKILFVCHRFPFPPRRGGKIRPFNVINHLHKNHEVTVFSLTRSKKEAEEGKGLAEFCLQYQMENITRLQSMMNMLKNLLAAAPFSMGYFYSSKLAFSVLTHLKKEKYDLIFVHCSSVAQYVEGITGIPKVLDFGDMDSQKWIEYSQKRYFPLSQIYKTEGKRLKRAEVELTEKFDYCTCTTRTELETLQEYNLNAKTGWFPNGVDLEYFSPSKEPYLPDTLCFIGRMDYYPNIECMKDFCRNTLPLIKNKRPGVKLSIIGADPSRAIRKLKEIPGVEVTGSVPDVRPHVQRCAVNIAPLNIARGTQNKILEAMAMGIPVVASLPASVGIDAVAGEHFLLGRNYSDFAGGVVQLLSDSQERRRFSEAGRNRMETHHNWMRSMGMMEDIINNCLETYSQ
jgi:polysaccharide biosynthesis protein PslH